MGADLGREGYVTYTELKQLTGRADTTTGVSSAARSTNDSPWKTEEKRFRDVRGCIYNSIIYTDE